MTDIAIPAKKERRYGDLVLAGFMLLLAVAAFFYLETIFEISSYLWYPLVYVGALWPFGGLVLHARASSVRFLFGAFLAAAVLLIHFFL